MYRPEDFQVPLLIPLVEVPSLLSPTATATKMGQEMVLVVFPNLLEYSATGLELLFCVFWFVILELQVPEG